jgi:hypothetical protein
VLHQYQAATQANNNALNPAYIGQFLNAGGVYAAPYLTPYSIQYNFGIQQQIGRGTVISGDYIHNSTLKIPLVIDVNRVGSARSLNVNAAKNAIAATLSACGVSSIQGAIASCPGLHSDGSGAVIQDFASNGLDSGNALFSGYPASVFGATPDTGAAFPGLNPALGFGKFILPTGQSGYDALQIVFKQVRTHPAPGLDAANFQISYNLSRIVGDVSTAGNTGNSGDNFFNSPPYDYDNPSAYMGRLGLDRKHQLSFGGSFTFKYGPQLGLVGHFFSALPTTLSMDNSAGETAQIFQTDVSGDGSTADLIPGTRPGAYMHDYKAKTLQSLITNYNSRYANTLTPAGQALVTNGLFSGAELVALQGAQQPIANLPGPQAMNNPMFRAVDLNLSYPIRLARLHEGMSLEPAIAFYNVMNFSNFGILSGQLLTQTNVGPTGASGFLNGPDNPAVADGSPRTQRGSGTFDQGGPRSIEYQLKFNF